MHMKHTDVGGNVVGFDLICILVARLVGCHASTRVRVVSKPLVWRFLISPFVSEQNL